MPDDDALGFRLYQFIAVDNDNIINQILFDDLDASFFCNRLDDGIMIAFNNNSNLVSIFLIEGAKPPS